MLVMSSGDSAVGLKSTEVVAVGTVAEYVVWVLEKDGDMVAPVTTRSVSFALSFFLRTEMV